MMTGRHAGASDIPLSSCVAGEGGTQYLYQQDMQYIQMFPSSRFLHDLGLGFPVIATFRRRTVFPNKLPSAMNSTTRPVNASTTLELSRNISTVLEQLLQNYDNRQRPDHG
ncbi:hypothetical protein TNCV_2747981, partial [Trichonephila clavipes]